MPELRRPIRCAIYTRKSSEEGLEQAFNSLDAQREACLAYVASQRHEGWRALETAYDDGAYSGATLERPAVQRLLADIDDGKIDTVVVYKVDRLTRSLTDFAKIVERFDARQVSFVSITQQFNTTSSMGRLTLNILLSFAQFEREVTGERIRDKIAASKKKGMWMGGYVPLGYDVKDRLLVVNPKEAKLVRHIYARYLALGCVAKLRDELKDSRHRSKVRVNKSGKRTGGGVFFRGALYAILKNRIYLGEVAHRGNVYVGEHEGILDPHLWSQVQKQLQANNQAWHHQTKAKSPSLLAGLLFDDRGNRLTPSHTLKRGKRFRYYVSQAVIQSERHRQGSVNRIPAQAIEDPVCRTLCRWLSSVGEVRQSVVTESDDAATQRAIIEAAKARAAELSDLVPSGARAFLCGILFKITLGQDALEIVISRQNLRLALLGQLGTSATSQDHVKAKSAHEKGNEGCVEEDSILLKVAIELKRYQAGLRLIVPSESQDEQRPNFNASLIKAIAQAHTWYEKLLGGQVTQVDIASQLGITDGYVSRLLQLAFLAPNIAEAILEGRQPSDLTLKTLLANIPIDWNAQRKALGI